MRRAAFYLDVLYALPVSGFLLFVLLSAAQAGCSPEATERLNRAASRARELDLRSASAELETDIVVGCETAQIAMLYVRGLIYAEDAFRQGGPPESLAPVRQAMTSLEAIARGRPGPAAMARLVLQAAAAAAQSERDEMSVYLESAVQMESLQLTAGQPRLPLVSAAEVAGDLWLWLHGYEAARRAFLDAAMRIGPTTRVLAGLARSAERLGDMPGACTAFRQLLDVWGATPLTPAPIAEARAYVAGCPSANP